MLQKQEVSITSIGNSLILNKICEFLPLKDLLKFHILLKNQNILKDYLENLYHKWGVLIFDKYLINNGKYYSSLKRALANVNKLALGSINYFANLSNQEKKEAFLGFLYFYHNNIVLINKIFIKLPLEAYLSDEEFQELIGRRSYVLLPQITYAVSYRIKHDKNLMLKYLAQDTRLYRSLPDVLRRDEDIVKYTIANNGLMIYSVPQNLQYKFIKDAITQNPQVYRLIANIDPALKYDYKILEETLIRDGLLLNMAPKPFKKNKPLVRLATMQNPLALKYAHYSIRGCKKFITPLVIAKPRAFQFIAKSLRNDPKIVMQVMNINGLELRHSELLKNNIDIVCAAIKNNPNALAFASISLRDTYNVVALAILKNGYCLRYASDRLKNNEYIVRTALSTYSFAIKFASLELRDKKELMLHAIGIDAENIQYASDWLRNDSDVIAAAMAHKPETIFYCGRYWQDNRYSIMQGSYPPIMLFFKTILSRIFNTGNYIIKKQYEPIIDIINSPEYNDDSKIQAIKNIALRNFSLTSANFFSSSLDVLRKSITDEILKEIEGYNEIVLSMYVAKDIKYAI